MRRQHKLFSASESINLNTFGRRFSPKSVALSSADSPGWLQTFASPEFIQNIVPALVFALLLFAFSVLPSASAQPGQISSVLPAAALSLPPASQFFAYPLNQAAAVVAGGNNKQAGDNGILIMDN